jgi:phage gpG-like protein
MRIEASIVGSAEVAARFRRAGVQVDAVVFRLVQQLGLRLLAHVKEDKLSDQVLHVRTGRLRRSINMRMLQEAGGTFAVVGTNVVYARIHELGGQTSPHEIVAKNAKALAFVLGVSQAAGGVGPGQLVFRRRVHHPGSKMPERSFLRSALGDMRQEIFDRLQAGIAQAVREELR